MNELALFAGAGGGILGGHLLGWRTVCAVEYDAYAASVLVARQNDGCLQPFPVWDDVRTFDGRPWRGIVDVVSGGFPCQDISAAGKGAGITGERSGLWSEMARIIGEVRPRHVLVENSPMLVCRGLDTVLCDLAALGYDAQWGVVGAHHAGAPHKRDRIWIVANATSSNDKTGGDSAWRKEWTQVQFGRGCCDSHFSDPDCARRGEQRRPEPVGQKHAAAECGGWWESEPELGRVANGVAHRVDRLRCIGNGQVPRVAQLAWEVMSNQDEREKQ